jgi:hypothetical protein
MKIEPSQNPQYIAKIPQDAKSIHSLPEHLEEPSATHPQAAEALGHFLNLPHDISPELLQKTLLISFLSAIASPKLPTKGG